MADEAYAQIAAAMRSAGASLDAVLAALRTDGATISDSVRVIRNLEGIRLGEAKQLVDMSPIWRDAAAVNRQVRSAAIESLKDEDPNRAES